jgi:hypothetical protein
MIGKKEADCKKQTTDGRRTTQDVEQEEGKDGGGKMARFQGGV